MPPNMTGEHPIEYYYPGGFGDIDIVDQDESSSGRTGDIGWSTPAILNKSYNETSPNRPMFEIQKILRPEDPPIECSTSIRLRASYLTYRTIPPTPPVFHLPLKYAIVGGVFPPSLTLDIDRGYLYGKIDSLEDIFPSEFPPTNEVDESSYGQTGSVTLHSGGFPIAKDIVFTARAFDPSLTGKYIDGKFTILLDNNWSSDRDHFILNIKNQMFIDGYPVTNKVYLSTMKGRGYFPNCS